MSYTLVLEWMPGDLYMSAVTARCAAPTSSYSVVWLPPNKVYQITLYCGSTSLVSFLVGAFRGKAWSYMNNERNNTTAGGIGFCGLLAVAFIVLKLTGVINWSWLWVLAPIWIPTAITLAIIVIVLVVILVRELTKGGRP